MPIIDEEIVNLQNDLKQAESQLQACAQNVVAIKGALIFATRLKEKLDAPQPDDYPKLGQEETAAN